MRGLEALPISLSGETPAEHMPFITASRNLSESFAAETGANRIPGLVSTDGRIASQFLQAASAYVDKPRPRFCEWGSGLGSVTCLAACMGWAATGIEIEPRLVSAARKLAARHHIPASFYRCSYKPSAMFDASAAMTDFDTGHGFGLFDFDLVYAYFWPAERDVMTDAFARHAHDGTILLRYAGGVTCEAFRIVRT
ncbi:class I SAM-dependent methyltransferase [Marivita sp. S6314]|uniref:class I SAM-dependent methyltransferase n=1 Tax=Marivita sp. S6314 TaxID=2926406 RepID=UPI001FF5D08E|nr:class I SAM-dependent methyltransferase [Marivita sp. S6314]MCK0148393.1 class I SAM-dependent methyltransferase [Marivita sp. S6314]